MHWRILRIFMNLLRGWPSPCAARRLPSPAESRQRRDPLFGPNHEEERVVFCEVSTNLGLEILHAILSVLCSLEVGKTYILSIIVECRVLEDNSSVHWDSDPSNSFLGAESERSDQGTQVSTNSEGRTGACTGGEWLTFRN